mmetsp:Transcript_32790/g.78313  ORF Transcript_32790/g.78313 Transcript_32790/m.78313 type:complete len:226 (-) Transcript_32790:953-1630(-)
MLTVKARIANEIKRTDGKRQVEHHIYSEVDQIKVVLAYMLEAFRLGPLSEHFPDRHASSLSHCGVEDRVPLRIGRCAVVVVLLRQIDPDEKHEADVRYPPEKVKSDRVPHHAFERRPRHKEPTVAGEERHALEVIQVEHVGPCLTYLRAVPYESVHDHWGHEVDEKARHGVDVMEKDGDEGEDDVGPHESTAAYAKEGLEESCSCNAANRSVVSQQPLDDEQRDP